MPDLPSKIEDLSFGDARHDQEAASHFSRAQARISQGRHELARADLEASIPALGDAARVELAYLDLKQGDLRGALHQAKEVAERAASAPVLRARALHVSGMALDRLRRTGKAISSLLEAADLYESAGNDLARAHVYDTLGQVHATRGRLDEATYYYAISLVDKAWANDRRGMAVTIGSMGRVQLRAGRFDEAIRCFERDLAMSQELGDLRAQARMYEDLGRAAAGLDRNADAEAAYRTSIELAERHGYPEIAFFAHIDLAALLLRLDRAPEARKTYERAARSGLAQDSPYHAAMLQTLQGALLLAEDREEGLDELRRGVRGLARVDAPDLEIPARIALAEAYARRGLPAMAEEILTEGLHRARNAGARRYLPQLAEAMGALDLVEPVLLEKARPRKRKEDPPANGAYVILERLGQGAAGEVYRALDPTRGREVALKVLHLERLYDVKKRKKLLRSARTELEAASRIRHPGVARVLAIGEEEDGGVYVTQELVRGTSLRTVMEQSWQAAESTALPAIAPVTSMASRLAFALEALHEGGVVHRDLKPENVIVRPDETPVLVDFGIAHLWPAGDAAEVAGTLEYMAPEQTRRVPLDGRADLYALGVIVFEWLVGFRPLRLQGRDREHWYAALRKEPAPRLREFIPDVDEALDRLVASLLAKRPDDRPATAAAAAEAFRDIGGE